MATRTYMVAGTAVLLAFATGTAAPATAAAASPATVEARVAHFGSPAKTVTLPKDQTVDGQWWFKTWRIGEVWNTGAQGQGITVAVIDTGVKADRPELAGVVLPGTGGPTGDGHTDTDTNVDGHGTSMAVLIAGQGGGKANLTGIAPQVKILPIDRHSKDTATNIRWAVNHGAKIINMSHTKSGTCLDQDAEAVKYAINNGAILVAGSGNDRSDLPLSAPANCPGVIAVGAVDSQLQKWKDSNAAPYLALAAPGVHMRWVGNSRRSGYTDGTSDSTALVSGAMALVWSAHPELTNRQVVARVLATAKDIGPTGRDEQSGFGVALPYNAVTANVPADAPNPIFDAAQDTTTTPTTTESPTTGNTTSPAPSTNTGTSTPILLITGITGLTLLLIITIAILATRRNNNHPTPTSHQPPPPGYPTPPHPNPHTTPPTPGQPYPGQAPPNPGQSYPGQGPTWPPPNTPPGTTNPGPH